MHTPLFRPWLPLVLACGLAMACAVPSAIAAPAPQSASSILLDLESFRETGSVLMIAAHPDDENTRLIAYFARGRGYRMGYLSLTRGDGGQNLIGTELDEKLGVIRTQELLAARRIDGGRQFFSRARDFGFSKDYAATLLKWDHQQVLSDTVRVIRSFRPDVLIARFSTVPGNTHGHHTASSIIALEAFKAAGDPRAFPEQLEQGLTPWQPKRIVWNTFSPAFRDRTAGDAASAAGLVRLDSGGYQPLLGESFGEIAALSRSMHRSQGQGTLGVRGVSYDYFQLMAGEPMSKDIMDGVDTTWARFPGGEEIGRLTDDVIAHFNPLDPAAGVPALLAIRTRLAALPGSAPVSAFRLPASAFPSDPVIADKQRQLDHILQACLGLYVETTVAQGEVVPGEAMRLRHTVIARTGFPVRWLGVRYPGDSELSGKAADLAANQPVSVEASKVLPASTPLSQPYWLREEGTPGMFRVDDPSLIGRPENPPAYPIEQVFDVGGQRLVIADEPVQVTNDPARGEVRRRLEVIPPVSLGFADDVELFAPGAARQAVVEVTAARAGSTGEVRLEAPEGWRIAPSVQPFHLGVAGERGRFTFTITAPAKSTAASIVASATVGGTRYDNQRLMIRYEHIPELLLQPPAKLKAVSLELSIRGHAVGYLTGAGDLVDKSLERMGYAVTLLTVADLTPERLRGFDAVVVGVRAFNTLEGLAPRLPALFGYAEAGGTVIVQYNTNNGLMTRTLAPFNLQISADRVTDENSKVTLLVPDSPVLNTPNKIGPADFDGWVQERARYLPREWDPRFVPIISAADPGEPQNSASLLVAHDGKGYFVYTGLSWFHELPAGVPGAYRLFANLVSLGK